MESFELKNYKSFINDKINISPITILLGKNSSGKSSLLQFLLLLQQTLRAIPEAEFSSSLKINGSFTNLGEIENIFYGKDLKKDIQLKFTFKKNAFTEKLSENIGINLYQHLEESINYLFRYYSIFRRKNDITLFDEDIFYKYRYRFEDIADGVKIFKGIKKSILKTTNFKDNRHTPQKTRFGFPEIEKIISIDPIEFKHAKILQKKIKSIKSDTVVIEFKIGYSSITKSIFTKEYNILSGDKLIFGIGRRTNKNNSRLKISSDILSNYLISKYKNKIFSSFKFQNLFYKFDKDHRLPTYPHDLQNIFIKSLKILFDMIHEIFNKSFLYDNINHIGPLRAYPKRHYIESSSGLNQSFETIDGENIPKLLKNNKLKKKLNEWCEFLGIKFDTFPVDQLITKLFVYEQNIKLDIVDVGFGYSQVLPVILQGFLSKENSLTLVEQPEIHLHPFFQSRLADLFVDIVNEDPSKRIIIETHSEYLLNRLRLKIAEGSISNDNVSIYFIHQRPFNNKKNKIERVKISKSGYFKWPIGFMDIDDTVQFLEHQISNNVKKIK